jgi:hypothetical protein
MVEMDLPAGLQETGHPAGVVVRVVLVPLQHPGLLVMVVLERLHQLQGLLFNMPEAAAVVWGQVAGPLERQVLVGEPEEKTQAMELLEHQIQEAVEAVRVGSLEGTVDLAW